MVLSGEITARIRQVLEQHPEGISITDLVKSVDVNRNTAGRYLENLLLSGQVEMRRFGMAKMYTLTKRLPVSSVLSLSSELVMQLDSGLRVFYANDPYLTFLGVTAKDLFGKNIEFTPFSMVFEDVFTDLLDRFRKGLRGEEWRGELSRPVRERFFFCRITPTVSNEGKKGVSVILEDISDRKRDEKRIRKSEARLRSIFKVSPVGIGVVADRTLLEVNDRFCEMTGYSPAEIVGRSARILYPSGEAFRNVGMLYTSQIRESGNSTLETQWLKKDGTVIDVLLNSTPLDPANISGGITFTAMDITARKQGEQALRESEEKYRYLVEQSLQGLTIIQDGRPVFANAAMLEIAGFSHEEYLALSPEELMATVHPGDRDHIAQVMKSRLEGRIFPAENEFRILRKDGQIRWALTRGMRIMYNRKPAIQVAYFDITARKVAEDALRESEVKFRTLFEGALNPVMVADTEGKYIEANEAALRFLETDRDELLKKSVWDYSPREIAEIQKKQHSPFTEPRTRETVYLVNGRMKTLILNIIPLQLQNKLVLIGIGQDITARKQAEQALRESEDRYRKLVEISPNAVLLHHDRKIIYANQALARILGAAKTDDLLGRDVLDLIHPAFRDEVRENITKDLTGMSTPFMELQMVRSDGTRVLVEGQGVGTSINGKPAVLVAITNITGRKLAEQELRESEQRYRTLSEASQDLIFLIDRDDRVEYVNSYAAAILGLPADQVIGKKRSTLFFGEPGERQAQALRQVFETGKAGRSEGPMEIFGTLHWFDHSLMPITDALGRVTSVLGVSRDITDRKETENALRASEERYRSLLGQTFDAVAIHKDKKIVFLNERAAQILGATTPDDLTGRPIFDLIHPESARDLEERMRMVAADPAKPAPVLREKFIRVDGTTVTVDVIALRITDTGVPAIQVMFREITSPEPK